MTLVLAIVTPCVTHEPIVTELPTVIVPEMGWVYGLLAGWSETSKFPSSSTFIFGTFAVTVPEMGKSLSMPNVLPSPSKTAET